VKVQLVAALLANGWYVEGTCIHAPNGTMQLSLETEWPGGELDLLKTMQTRLSRISGRLDEQHFHISILDTISCMDAIISLISSVEIVLR